MTGGAIQKMRSLGRLFSSSRRRAAEGGIKAPFVQRWCSVSVSITCVRSAEPVAMGEKPRTSPSSLTRTMRSMPRLAAPRFRPDSACADYGDAPSGGIHKVFDRLAADLSSLLLRTRSLIVIDWRANREIHSVIRNYLTGLAEGPAGPITGR